MSCMGFYSNKYKATLLELFVKANGPYKQRCCIFGLADGCERGDKWVM